MLNMKDHMDWKPYTMDIVDEEKYPKVNVSLCQNADCPKRGEVFIKEHMIQVGDLVFCSKECASPYIL